MDGNYGIFLLKNFCFQLLLHVEPSITSTDKCGQASCAVVGSEIQTGCNINCTSFIFRPLKRHEKESLYQGGGCYSTSLRRVAYSWATTSSQLIILMLKEYSPSLRSGSKPQPQTLIQPFLAEALITCLDHFKMLLGL